MSIDVKNVCRICMKKGNFLFPLLRSKNKINLVKIIYTIAEIKIEMNDGLPQSICDCCYEKIEITSDLIQKCKNSDDWFKQNLQQNREISATPDTVDNCENLLYQDASEEIEVIEVLGDLQEDDNSQCQLLDVDDIIEEESLEDDGLKEPAQEIDKVVLPNENSNSCVDDLIIADPLAQVAEGKEANYTQCCGCVQQFVSYKELQEHSVLYHSTDKAICGPVPDNLIECSICYKMFSGVAYLDSMHRLNAFKNRLVSVGYPEVLQCCSCDATFSGRAEILQHPQQHIQERVDNDPARPFECQFCFKRYNQKQALNFHQKFSSSYKKRLIAKRRGCRAIKKRTEFESATDSRKCCGCSAEFPSIDSLKQHSLMHHELYRRKIDHENPFECEICFKQFPTLIRLEQHRFVPYTRNHKCAECEKTFLSSYLLQKHLKTHEENQVKSSKITQPGVEQNLQCDECGEVVRNKYILKAHLKSKHSTEKPFQCSLCFRQFKWKHTLQNHLRVHTKEQPFACSFCPRTFTQLTDKNRHESCHNKQYPLRCAVCDKGYPAGRRKELEKHEKLHEAGEEYPLTCQFCDRTFTRLVQRNRHQARHVAERDRNMKMKLEEIGIV